mmetsp:Transcript_17247/g.20545  ORF Transcript_17247/g.20545 Transcript_17247/m.20545 type:complete len:204 (+) Transcript_17247:176-787(+)|eukprot:CAMPEP_0198249704 /NCGR_PEP_ID=MMETSP1447-20131203/1136_1 /TAXON_ID=420782 /ORGANISM="Chaetoceros dichaeta, Strain CCMP1751" /LENGTH=203 /DNA_ID=CAMNT_0043934391 /DNA_START=136 /DNA_END=747 /DNA_ORIENTATION=-
MKIFGPIILLNLSSSAAFTLSPQSKCSPASPLHMSTKNTNDHKLATELPTRRDSIATLLTSAIAFATTTTTVLTPTPSYAREALPEYLSEPTDAFKESERQRDEFRRKQLLVKKQFNDAFARLTFDSTTEDQIRGDLEDLKSLIIKTGGLPTGIKKEEMVKIIRAKKAKGFWPTSVEYAYQALIRELAYQQSPNKDKDVSNPL